MSKPMRTVSFKLPAQLDDVLSSMARQRNTSRSALVCEAIKGLTKRKERSVTALVDELLDGVDGSVDLSSNARHMAGYGK